MMTAKLDLKKYIEVIYCESLDRSSDSYYYESTFSM